MLRLDGHMLVYETHPFLEMFDPESTSPHTPTFSYFKTQPHVETGLITYDGEKAAGLATTKHYRTDILLVWVLVVQTPLRL